MPRAMERAARAPAGGWASPVASIGWVVRRRHRHVLPIVACGGPSPPTDAPGCGSRPPEATRLRRVLHCVPAQASKLAWVPRAAGCREGAHDGGEMGLRRIAKE
jgi:hypothetical protein